MYSIKLDNTKHFTGTYAKIGKIDGGVDIKTLPPDMSNAIFYIYDYHDVTSIELVPDIDDQTQEQKKDENNNLLFIENTIINNVLEWYLDEEKYNQWIINDLQKIKREKIDEIGLVCEQIIYNGIDVLTTNGNEHFSFSEKDQRNIKNAYDISKVTNLSISYHADNSPCRLFTVQEISDIYMNMEMHITYYTTLCNMLNTWIRRSITKEEISSIGFDSILPDDLQLLLNENLAQANIILETLRL